jgi:spore maturation protein CgeB
VRFALFFHSVRSDWNNGHAHFLRGVVQALQTLGHDTVCYEEAKNWSATNLVHDHGIRPLVEFRRRFPSIHVRLYARESHRELERRLAHELSGVDVVMVDEWPAVENLALTDLLIRLKRRCGYTLLLRDGHYRILTVPVEVRSRLDYFDAVLPYGPSMAEEYRRRFGLEHVYVLHEAADITLFRPLLPDPQRPIDDAVFIGNLGERDRVEELQAFLLQPAKRFRGQRRFAIHGVRYPPEVVHTVRHDYGVEYRGWLANYLVPAAFAQARLGIHVIRRQYASLLHGIPTIRVFEALACGLPLVSTRWHDTDGLFRAGRDYVVVDNRGQMEEALDWLWRDDRAREQLAANGLARVRAQHTCLHRAEQLLGIVARLRAAPVKHRQRVSAPVAIAHPTLDVPVPANRDGQGSPVVSSVTSAGERP